MTTRNRLITYTICTLLGWGCQEDNLPPQNIPVISNVTVTGITENTALCTFTVTITEAIHSVGINYGTDSSQLTGDFSIDDISGNTFTLPLNNLADDMMYYYKVYVRDKMFTYIYSEIGEFKTQSSPYGSTFSNGITPARSFRGGDGTQNNPYLIANAQQLKKLVNDVNNGGNGYANTYFKLTTDIQVTADEWIPIGYGNFSFNGNFDGNGHTISGTLKSDKYREFGFFGQLGNNTRISNLTIAATVRNEGNFASTSSSSVEIYTGAIAGRVLHANVIISNCHITGTVTGGVANGSYTGGVLGYGSGTIQNCDISGNITGGSAIVVTDDDSYYWGGWAQTGGIVGRFNWGEITNCTVFNSATIIGNVCDQPCTGGIAGVNGARIYDCTNHANVTGGSNTGNSDTGGIVGNNYGEINNCTNTSTVTGGTNTNIYARTGGIAGVNSNSIINCIVSANGMVVGGGSGANLTGGIAGLNAGSNGNITNCTNNANVSASYVVGGLVGINNGEIHTSLNTGNITDNNLYRNNYTGGLAGWNNDNNYDYTHLYSCCTNRGTVNGQAANANNQIGNGKEIEPCQDGHAKR